MTSTTTTGLEAATLIEQIIELPFKEMESLTQPDVALDEAALTRLLDEATDLARSNPEKARVITAVCLKHAPTIQATHLIPRATYIQAQTHAAKGELEESLHLIQQAHDGYQALDQELSALRTRVGRIHVLNELGRHQEALATAQAVMAQLTQSGELEHNREAQLVAGLACQNKGVCCRLMGRYEAALAAYAAAESWFQTIGLRERVGDIQNNRGIILLHLGRASEALVEFESASAILGAAGRTLLQAQSLINSGDAHLHLGSYTHSLTALAEARHLLSSLDGFGLARSLLLQEAHVYLALNLYPEALSAYRQAEAACREAGYHYYQARALWGMSVALVALGQLEEAELAQVQAIDLFQAAGNVPLLCGVKLEQAALQAARGEQTAALDLAQAALDLVAAEAGDLLGRWPVQRLYAHLRLADLHLPDLEKAETHLLQAQELAEVLVLPHLRYRLYQRLGWLRWQQGQVNEAEQWLQTAVSEIEQLRGTVAQEAMRISFWRDKTAAYENLLQLYLERGSVESVPDAFLVAEQAKSRTLLDLLNGVITANTPQPAATAQQLAQLQADLNAIYNAFLETNEMETPPNLTDLRRRAQLLEQEINQRRLQSGSTSVLDPFATVLPPATLLTRLPDDLLLIAYHIIGDEILAFVKVGGTLRVVQGLTTVTAIQRHLNQLNIQWRHFRAGEAFVQRHKERLLLSAQRVLQTLYQALVEPLLPLLPITATTPQPLAIVPHGLLHQVPFHALYDGQAYLLDRFEISYAPSTGVLALCQERPYHIPQQGAVFGLPDPLIPAVEKEVTAVAHQLPQAQTYLAEAATITAVRQQLAQAPPGVLHFACHGLFRADNPIFSALKLHDGWLTAADILAFDLRDTLVTLSACESGRARVDAGDEVLGLARAFLGSGAASLVVSLWVVEDETTAALMADWYTNLTASKMKPVTALRAAQLAQKERAAHPYYWAPFLLMGKR